MNDEQLLRYSRHILLDDIGIEGQRRLLAAHALVIGAGGLGSAACLYLAASGVGCITIVDDDRVDLTNLQRQIAHTQARIGTPKVLSATEAMRQLNPEVTIHAVEERADASRLLQRVAEADVVLDCSDNYDTRHALNAACVAADKPLVAGAAVGFDAQISVFAPAATGSPCYACVFPPGEEPPAVQCATMGVLAPLVGIIGSMQAAEALKLLTGAGESLAGRLLMLDGRRMEWTSIGVSRDPDCPVCGHTPQRPPLFPH